MKRLQEILSEADQQKVAVGHFNISDLVALKAVYLAAREANVPVLVGVSEGERDFIGVRQIAALVRSIREQNGFPVYLNADHTHSIEKAREAAHAGFDSVVFDCSALPFERNQDEASGDRDESDPPHHSGGGRTGFYRQFFFNSRQDP